MQPGDLITANQPIVTSVSRGDAKDYYVTVEGNPPTIAVTLCNIAHNKVVVLKVFYEGLYKPNEGPIKALIKHLPIEEVALLSCHRTEVVRNLALKRLATPEGRYRRLTRGSTLQPT